jgi:hypothetical protein
MWQLDLLGIFAMEFLFDTDAEDALVIARHGLGNV